MKILIERNIATLEQQRDLSRGAYKNKVKIANEIINSLPNARYLQGAKSVYAQSMIEDGTDDDRNPFLIFMQNTRNTLPRETVNVIKNLINSNKLSPQTEWLYNPSLYNESDENNLFKIKALTYASNSDLQRNAKTPITIDKFITSGGKPLSADEMRKILQQIQIDSNKKSLTVRNVLDSLFRNLDLGNEYKADKLKKYLSTSFIRDLDDESRKRWKNIDMNKFANMPIKEKTKEAIIELLKNISLGQTSLRSNRTYSGADLLELQKVEPHADDRTFINYVAHVCERPINNIQLMLSDKAMVDYVNELLDQQYSGIDNLNDALKDLFVTGGKSTNRKR